MLADEINRASPKTQSALLEAMEERQITVDGDDPRPGRRRSWSSPRRTRSTRRAPTGCPRASSTASCCASRLGYPGRAAEMSILDGRGAVESLPKLSPVVSAAEVMTMIEAVRSVFLADALKAYLVDIAEASRRHPAIELGLSPRATLQLAAAARSHAAARGRRYATPDDVKVMAVAVPQPPAAAAHRPRRPPRPGRRHRRDPRRRAGAGRPLSGALVRARPTRQGIIVLVAAVGALVIGRLFGVLELFVIGAALLVAALRGVARRRRAPARGSRSAAGSARRC